MNQKEQIAKLKRELAAKEREIKKLQAQVTPTSALDTQHGGDHYKKLGMYQPWMVAQAQMNRMEFRGAAKFTATTYLAREEDKGGDEDIYKAYHTLAIWIELDKRYDEQGRG